MFKAKKLLPALLLIICILIFTFFRHLIPIALTDIIGIMDLSPNILSVCVVQQDGSNKWYDVTEEVHIKPLLSLLQDINVSFVESTDKIPVLYKLTFGHRKTNFTEYYHSMEMIGNGYVYADGKLYHISASDEAQLLSAIEQLIGSL